MVHFTRPASPEPVTGQLPFAAAPTAIFKALQAALAPAGPLAAAEVRSGELRLQFADLPAWLRVGAKGEHRAFVEAGPFGLGSEGPNMAPETAARLHQLAALAGGGEAPTVMLAAMEGEAAVPSSHDVRFAAAGELAGFVLADCDGGRAQKPRKLGPLHLLLAGEAGAPLRIFRAAHVPDREALFLHGKCVLGVARVDGAVWRLAEKCRACPARIDCAGCFAPPTAPAELPMAPAEALHVDGAELLALGGRRQLAARLAACGPRAAVVATGMSPAAVVGDAAGPPGAEPALVARTLRAMGLQLVDYRLPGRQGAEPWHLHFAAHAPDQLAPQVSHLTLLVNRKCVTVCRYCNLPLRLRDNMEVAEVYALLQEAAVLGVAHVELFGGEVTLRQDLFALIEYGNAIGLKLYVTTTGVGLSARQIERLAQADIADLAISLDSADPRIHDDLKSREGMHAAAVSAARQLKAAGARWLGSNTVVTKSNFRGLPALIDLVADLGMGGATLFFCQPIAEIGQGAPWLDAGEVRELIEEILPRCRHIARNRNIVLAVRPPMEEETGDRQTLYARAASGHYNALHGSPRRCEVADRLACVQPGGEVRLCNQPIAQFEPAAVVGNVRDASLSEVLSSEKARAFRRQAGQFEFCRYCTFDHGGGDG